MRKPAYVIGKDFEYKDLDLANLLKVEQGIRALNRAHWEVNDFISLALDPDNYDLFLLDLSAAQVMNGQGCYRADDEWRIYEFFKLCGNERLIVFRHNASHQITGALWGLEHPGYRHVYASFSRPISALWASSLGDAEFIHEQYGNWEKQIPWTWVITKEPLPAEILERYELRWGWSPIHDKE